MADTLADLLSAGFGNPVDREGARREGLLENAKTSYAMTRARSERAKARRAEQELAAFERAGELDFADPNLNLADIILGDLGGNYKSATGGRLNAQEFDTREMIVDPATDPDQRHYARASLYSDPTNLPLADELTEATIGLRGSQTEAADALAEQRRRLDGDSVKTPEELALEAFAKEFGGTRGERAAYDKLDAGQSTDFIRDLFGDESEPLSPTLEITATGPNGEKIVLRNGQWVPADGG